MLITKPSAPTSPKRTSWSQFAGRRQPHTTRAGPRAAPPGGGGGGAKGRGGATPQRMRQLPRAAPRPSARRRGAERGGGGDRRGGRAVGCQAEGRTGKLRSPP